MRSLLTSITLAALLSGCTNKEHTELLVQYEKKKHYHKELLKTEKVQLYENNLTKVALTATYLNPFDSKEKDSAKADEKFIVGLYVDDDADTGDHSLDLNLTLNGMAPKSIVPLPHDDKRLKHISFVSEWKRFFLVTFPHVNAKRFKLVVQSDTYGKGELDFAKQAKYTFDKKIF